MTTDRDLLEAAAKAYGGDEIDDVCAIRWLEADQSIGYTHGDNQDHNGADREYVWNPLTDDGDALRLAGKLGMALDLGSDMMSSAFAPVGVQGYACDHGADPGAATRRAIVRAAAAVGKTPNV